MKVYVDGVQITESYRVGHETEYGKYYIFKGSDYNNGYYINGGGGYGGGGYGGSGYTPSFTNRSSFDIVFNNLKDVPAVQPGSVITVEYTSELNSNVITTNLVANNKIYVEYSNNPYFTEEHGRTPEDLVRVFTYVLEIVKTGTTTDDGPIPDIPTPTPKPTPKPVPASAITQNKRTIRQDYYHTAISHCDRWQFLFQKPRILSAAQTFHDIAALVILILMC